MTKIVFISHNKFRSQKNNIISHSLHMSHAEKPHTKGNNMNRLWRRRKPINGLLKNDSDSTWSWKERITKAAFDFYSIEVSDDNEIDKSFTFAYKIKISSIESSFGSVKWWVNNETHTSSHILIVRSSYWYVS